MPPPSSSATKHSQPPLKPLKILMLHGYTQSGPLFHAKTRALEKNLQKAFRQGVHLHYPTAPIRLSRADVPNYDPTTSTSTDATATTSGSTTTSTVANDDDEPDAWGWWTRTGDREPYTYVGLEDGLAHVAAVLQSEGPFDGVIGFSQGGAAAGMVASLLEPGRRDAFARWKESKGGIAYPESFVRRERQSEDGGGGGGGETTIHPPLKFAVSYSGFGAGANPAYGAFYEPKIATPMLHFLGTLDTVVEEARSLRLVAGCERTEGRVVYHPGGHFLPSSQKQYVSALVAFIREVMTADEESGQDKSGDAADMDVPF